MSQRMIMMHDYQSPPPTRCVKMLVKAILGSLAVTSIAIPAPAFAVHRQFAPEPRNWTGGAFYGTHGTFFADFDGDGKADAIAVNDDRVWVRRSDGCRFLPNEQWTSTPFYGTRGTFFSDVTGDGKADAIAVYDDRIVVRRSEDKQRRNWINEPYYGNLGTFFVDVSGDGKADAIVVNDWGVTVRRSNGWTAFDLPNEDWSMGPYYGTRGTFFADVTKDKRDDTPKPRADAIVVNDWGVTVRRSRFGPNFSFLGDRDHFSYNETWTNDPYFGTRGAFFADVTGDGRADAIVVNDDGIAVRDSLGSSFRSPDPTTGVVSEGGAVIKAWGYWTLDPFYGTRETSFADVNGDGTADAIAVNDDGVFVRRSTFTNWIEGDKCR